MKKYYLILLLFCCYCAQAQDSVTVSRISRSKNEVRVDLLSLIASSKLNLTYERFVGKRFSVGISGNFINSSEVDKDFDNGNRNTIPKYEITPFVRYNLSQGSSSFYFAEVFVCANGGDYRETVRMTDVSNTGYYTIQKSDYSDVAPGAGIGYKFYIKQRVAVELLVGFGWNLIDREKSPDVLSRVGLSVGYRF